MSLGVAVGVRGAAQAGPLAVAAIPLIFLITGITIRYAAFLATSSEAGFAPFAEALCRWDCGWYIGIAEQGYEEFPVPGSGNVGNWGFFPLYPKLVSLLLPFVPLPTIQVATLASLACTYCACLVAWPLLERKLAAYTLYSAFLLAGPFSFYFSTFLTEPLFVLLTLLTLLGVKRRNYLAAASFAALLSATRIVGVFIFFVIFIQMVLDHRSAGGRLIDFPRHVIGRPDLLVAIFLAPAGLFTYMLFLYVTVGDGFAFSHVQRAFGRVVDLPVLHLWDGLSATPSEGWWPRPPQFSAVAAIVGLALAGWLALRRQYGVALFATLCIVLPLSSGLASMVRYVVGLAPVGLAAAELLSRSRLATAAALIAFLIACYFFTQQWIGGHLALV